MGRRTSIEDELQFDELHVDEIGVERFMSDPHPDVFDLGEVTMERVVKALLKEDELGQLPSLSEGHAYSRSKLIPESTSRQRKP